MSKKKIRKSVDWILFTAAIALILFLTFQNNAHSAALTVNVQQDTVRVAQSMGMATPNPWWNRYRLFRKFGHLVEYLALGLAAGNLFRHRKFSIAVIVCAVVSICDQTLKTFIPGREFDWTDLPFDVVAYVIGIVVVRIIVSIYKQSKNHKE